MPRNPLATVAAKVIICTKCLLHRTRKNAVPGVGSPGSKIMFIGEAPGRSEDIEGEPFVGAAGKFLDLLMTEAGLSRERVFITNVVKCRPPRNRQPSPGEIQTCSTYLDSQIRSIKPRIIVTLGNHSTAYLLSKANVPFTRITQTHGRLYEATILGISVAIFPTFHPAAALYSGEYKKLLISDFQLLRNEFAKKNNNNGLPDCCSS